MCPERDRSAFPYLDYLQHSCVDRQGMPPPPARSSRALVEHQSPATPCLQLAPDLLSTKTARDPQPFSVPLWESWETRAATPSLAPSFSKSPELHSLRFRKPAPPLNPPPESSCTTFPLFLCELRVLLSFLLLNNLFPTLRRAFPPPPASRLKLPNAKPIRLNTKMPHNPEMHPCFPRP